MRVSRHHEVVAQRLRVEGVPARPKRHPALSLGRPLKMQLTSLAVLGIEHHRVCVVEARVAVQPLDVPLDVGECRPRNRPLIARIPPVGGPRPRDAENACPTRTASASASSALARAPTESPESSRHAAHPQRFSASHPSKPSVAVEPRGGGEVLHGTIVSSERRGQAAEVLLRRAVPGAPVPDDEVAPGQDQVVERRRRALRARVGGHPGPHGQRGRVALVASDAGEPAVHRALQPAAPPRPPAPRRTGRRRARPRSRGCPDTAPRRSSRISITSAPRPCSAADEADEPQVDEQQCRARPPARRARARRSASRSAS